MSKTYKTEGIVFRSLKYSETSLILDIYTKERGLGSFIVSGVRKAKSKMANVYHPMNIIELVAYKNDGLARIKEASYAIKYERLDRDVIKSSIGTFFIDLLRSSIKEKESSESLYNHIRENLLILDKGDASLLNLPIRMAIELSTYLGFQIVNNYNDSCRYFDLQTGQFISDELEHSSVLDEEISLQLHLVMQAPLTHKLSRIDRHKVMDTLMDFYKVHVEGFEELRSLPVLRTLLS